MAGNLAEFGFYNAQQDPRTHIFAASVSHPRHLHAGVIEAGSPADLIDLLRT
jgi:hypothetical protein